MEARKGRMMNKEHNLFNEQVLKKAIFSWHSKVWLWILPTHSYIHEGLTVHYKRWGLTFYLMKIEKEKKELELENR